GSPRTHRSPRARTAERSGGRSGAASRGTACLDGCAQPAGEALERPVERDRFDAVLPPGAEHVQPAGLAVVHRLDPADHAVATQDREHVVAVLALRLRYVHLEAVEEVPERVGAVAVVDEPVEG